MSSSRDIIAEAKKQVDAETLRRRALEREEAENDKVAIVADRATTEKALNTKRSYKRAQDGFIEFCRKTFPSEEMPELVTGEKLLAYLVEQQNAGKVITINNENGEREEQTNDYSLSYFELITSAVINLFNSQKAQKELETNGVCNWQFPRTSEVKSFLENYKRLMNDKEKEAGSGSGSTNKNQYYTPADLEKGLLWSLGYSTSTKSYIDIIAILVLSQSLLSRGDSIRELSITDISVQEKYNAVVKNTASDGWRQSGAEESHIPMMCFLARKGTYNFTESNRITGVIRHQDVLLCPQWWLSCNLIERFHVKDEDPLSFKTKEDFYNCKLFVSYVSQADHNKPISYQYQYENIKKVMRNAKILTDNVTDGPRASGFRICQLAGVSPNDVEWFGSWKTEIENPSPASNSNSNYNYVRLGPVVALAGGTWKDGIKYEMNRYFVKPKEELKRMIFPFINDILDFFEGTGTSSSASGLDLPNDEEALAIIHRTVKTLDYCRSIFLQDYKFFVERVGVNKLKNIPLFKLPVFETPEYQTFRQEQDRYYEEYQMRRTGPDASWQRDTELVEAIKTIATNSAANSTEVILILHKLQEQMNHMRADMKAMAQDVKTLKNWGAQALNLPSSSSSSSSQNNLSPSSATIPSFGGFSFRRSPSTFEEIWLEYKIPRNGRMSVEELDKKYKSLWRKETDMKRKYTRRNAVYKAMKTGLARGKSEEECYLLLERARRESGLSISGFMDKPKNIPLELK